MFQNPKCTNVVNIFLTHLFTFSIVFYIKMLKIFNNGQQCHGLERHFNTITRPVLPQPPDEKSFNYLQNFLFFRKFPGQNY